MSVSDLAFDDFVDDCLLEDDSFCKYRDERLDLVVAGLVSIDDSDDLIAS